MAQGTRLYDRHQEDSERASERTEAVSWWVETARAAIAKLETTTTTTEQLFSHDLETYRERVIAGEVEEDLFDGTTMLNVIKDADTACGEVRHALAMILDTLSRSTTEARWRDILKAYGQEEE
jgi:hypothetical protein